MVYVELVTPEWEKREIAATEWAYPRVDKGKDGSPEVKKAFCQSKTFPESMVPRHDVICASSLLNLSSRSCQIELTTEEASITENQDESISKTSMLPSTIQAEQTDEDNKSTVSFLKSVANSDGKDLIKRRSPAKRPKSSKVPKKRHVRSLHEIVVPTLQEGHDLLPVSGGWKFFPLPEFRNKKVDLGTHARGWQLKLVPISFEADPILLDVPIASLQG